MSIESIKSRFEAIYQHVAELDKLTAVKKHTPATGTPSQKVANIIDILYEDIAQAEGKPLAVRRIVLEQADKILDEVSQIESESEESSVKATSKGTAELPSESVRLCRDFLKWKKEEVDSNLIKQMNEECSAIAAKTRQNGSRESLQAWGKLLANLPPSLVEKLEKEGNATFGSIKKAFLRDVDVNYTEKGGVNLVEICNESPALVKWVIDGLGGPRSWKHTLNIVENFKKIKTHAPDEVCFEAAFFFRINPSYKIGTKKEITAALQDLKEKRMTAPRQALEKSNKKADVQTGWQITQFKKAIEIAKKLYPDLDTKKLEADL